MRWCQTFTGGQFWPLHPRPEDVKIEDIAHALSQVCRFAGHSIWPYSVGHHSLLVSANCRPENALVGLLHDAPEAFVGDMVTPLKRDMPTFEAAERGWALAIGDAFGLGEQLVALPADVKEADVRALMTEKRDVMSTCSHPWHSVGEPFETSITPATAPYIEDAFMRRFESLRKKLGG